MFCHVLPFYHSIFFFFVLFSLTAQALGFPFLSPYLQSIGTNYRHGANYATLASTVLLPNSSLFVGGLSPFALSIQFKQMKEFKARVDELHSSGTKGKHNGSIFKLFPHNLTWMMSLIY